MGAPVRTCISCDKPLPDAAAFCPSCGAPTPDPLITAAAAGADASSAQEAHYRRRLQTALGEGFELREQIGRGGFGTVYVAWDRQLEREVAVKALRFDLIPTPELLARFKREARVVAQLRHPNIVPVYAVGEGEGLTYFVMPRIAGESLREALRSRGKLSAEEAARILTEVGGALDAAHRVGLIHRDVKPENILLEGDERRALLMDFGIVKTVAAGQSDITGTGFLVGTPQYMSPEQASGARELDRRSDVYSLAVVGYEMLAGRLPFEADSLQGLVYAHVTAAPPDLGAAAPDAPPALAAVIMRALAKAPDGRQPTARAFADAIQRASQPVLAGAPTGLADRMRGLARRWGVPGLVGFSVVLVGLLGAGALGVQRYTKARWAKREALPQILRLVERGEAQKAFVLAERAERYLRGDSLLAALWPRMSTIYTIRTTPASADVWFKNYSALDSAWVHLGRTPLERLRFPIGAFRFRFVQAGFDTLETVRATPEAAPQAAVLSATLHRTGEVPPGWVRIEGGDVRIAVAWLDSAPPVKLPPFLIGKFEVTNAEFQRFVEAGGYRKPEYWRQPFVRDGRPVRFDEAVTAFRDRTGRPGPATWEGGRFRPGTADHPVAGVSWYEAEAYAAFAGVRLPTVYHWSAAASARDGQVIVPLSNFAADSSAPVGSHPGIGATGVYDMAGNVREWCSNLVGDGPSRFALGGGWGDPPYMFLTPSPQSPWDRLPNVGFRLLRPLSASDTVPSAALAPLRLERREVRGFRPVSDREFETWRAYLYAYDRKPLNAVVEAVDESSPLWRRERISFDAAYGGERLTAYLFTPRGLEPPFQAVVHFPTSDAFVPGISDSIGRRQGGEDKFWEFLPLSGRAVLVPVYRGSYERHAAEFAAVPIGSIMDRDFLIQIVNDLRRSVDYLVTRPDIDSSRIAYSGVSFGANLGPIMNALEPRLKTAVWLIPVWGVWRSRPEVDPFNFAPRATTPVLVLSGGNETMYLGEEKQDLMFALLGTAAQHKVHLVYPGGHGMYGLYGQEARRDILAWLDLYLGRVR